MLRTVVTCLCLASTTAYAQMNHSLDFIFDKHMSPYTGSGLSMSIMSLYKAADDAWIPPVEGRTPTTVSLRAAKTFLLEGTLSSWLMVWQHEFFGHGWQGRKYNVSTSYNFGPFRGTSIYDLDEYNTLSAHQQIRLTASGTESSQILSEQLKKRWLETGRIDNRDAMLYLLSKADETDYITDFRDGKPTTTQPLNDKHDMDAYMRQVNAWHNKTVIRGKRLRKRIFYEYLDPFLFFSIISSFNTVWNGVNYFDYPVLSFGDLQYLPSIRTLYAPYGPETQLNNYFIGPNHSYQVHLRYGKNGDLTSHGVQVKYLPKSEWMGFHIDGQFDVWRQPKLLTSSPDLAKRKLGGLAAASITFRGIPGSHFGLQLGYKSKGYVPGEQLEQGLLLKLLLQWHF